MLNRLRVRCRLVGIVLLVVTVAAVDAIAAEAPGPQVRATHVPPAYASPQAAVDDLVTALRAADFARMRKVLGPGSDRLIRSGDAVADANGRARFIAAYDARAAVELQGDDRATLVIGENDWPFPVPLVKTARGWSFDTASGARELLDRRIGRNELSAIQVCLAYVDAQREYAQSAGNDGGVHQYARKFSSSSGRKDGLYWPTPEGGKPSPLGPLVGKAHTEGYARQPYHGYRYRILLAQGPDAQGGAYDYVVKGRMIGGFALVAYPARWGSSGVMTFIVNHDGVVYEKNFGPRTSEIASRISRFDPDSSWNKVQQ